MFKIEQNVDGEWEWECFQSAYGIAWGNAETLAQAKVELALAEARMMEEPYPDWLEEAMRKRPEMWEHLWPDPEPTAEPTEDTHDATEWM